VKQKVSQLMKQKFSANAETGIPVGWVRREIEQERQTEDHSLLRLD